MMSGASTQVQERHSMDGLVSFYMQSPSGFDLELGVGGELLGPGFVLPSPSESEVCKPPASHNGLGPDRSPDCRPARRCPLKVRSESGYHSASKRTTAWFWMRLSF